MKVALDTRASANFISGRVATPRGGRPVVVQLASQGMTTTSEGTVLCNVVIDCQEYDEEFLVVEDLADDVILGDPWLRRARATLDYGLRCVHHGSDRRATTFWADQRPPPPGAPLPHVQHSFPDQLASAFEDALRTFRAVTDPSNCVGAVRAVRHVIRLEKDEPFRLRPYPLNEHKRRKMDECVHDMLAAGVIEHSVSDYCSPAVRFCNDYRRLNALTKDEAAPLPKIQDALRDFGAATVFSAIDLKSGYWQIPMDEGSKHLTTFATPDGATYQYRVMPFGLQNAPATFQKLMTRVLAGYLGKFTHVYLDDIIVYSRDYIEHLGHLRRVFERLQEYGLRCAVEKCRFGVAEPPYLGHVVGREHNRPQEQHLRQIAAASAPTTRKQLQSFLGLANWVREYVPRFAELSAPMTDLLNSKNRFRWTDEAQRAFDDLKREMGKPLHLHRPDFAKRFVLQTDASGVGIAAVLYQEDGERRLVVSYASAKLNQTQRRYHVNEQECLAIVWAVRKYRAYLEDREFTLRTDNKALLWLNSAKDINAKLTRWALLLQEFKFRVEHCPGKDNQLPDLLSRDPAGDELTDEVESIERMLLPSLGAAEDRHDDQASATITTLAAIEVVTFADEIRAAQLADPEFPGMIRRLEAIAEEGPQAPGDAAFARNYYTEDGFLWRRGDPRRLWVPTAARPRVLHEFHESPEAGHPGRDETIRAVERHYTWSSLSADVQKYVRGCLVCATTKRGGARQPRAPLRAYIPKKPWQTIAVDYMGPYHETPAGNRYLLVVTDIFSKWVEAFPVPRATAKATVRLMEEEVFCRWGYLRSVISDNGTQFTSEAFQNACRRWKTRHWRTAVFHPRANPTERKNQDLKKLMRVLIQDSPGRPWDETIPKGLFNLRRRRNAATGQSPSELLMGFEITRPGHWDADERPVQTTAEERQRFALQQMDDYRQRYDGGDRQPATYEVGDKVLVRRHVPPGLRTRWVGPRTIAGVAGENCYKIDHGTHTSVEHVDHLRPVLQVPEHRTATTQTEPEDETPIHETVGQVGTSDDDGLDNASLQGNRPNQRKQTNARRRRRRQ
ncbi:hypothetical protein Zmor_015536 [Zophobas morio]|uniref:RNA-directed DNA polymerase n=1 Tax=Zophobas morio TaxID=2755281 RepID=A0AA38IHA3_9CUCU|nr:hypothetical protein Zmor_015536 [Zophobas morio]